MSRSSFQWALVVLASAWILQPDAMQAQRPRFTVGAPIAIAAGDGGPQAVALGDVNNDGRTDIVVVSIDEDGPLAVLINDGNGAFSAPRFVSDEEGNLSEPIAIAVADVGSVSGGPDGNADIVVVDNLEGGYLVAFGDGTGNFAIEGDVTLPEGLDSPVAVAVADFDGQNGPDLAIADEDSADDNGEVHFFCNEGIAGLFVPCPTNALTTGGELPIDMGTGDFNGDGRVDIVVLNQGGAAGEGRVALFTGSGGGNFTIPQQATFPVANEPRDLVVASLNSIDDTIDDVAVAEFEVLSDDNVTILLGGTSGAIFTRPDKALLEVATTAIAAGSFAGSADSDLAGGNDPEQAGSSLITVANGNGDGSFQDPQQGATLGGGAVALVAGRLNDDDLDDLVALNLDGTEVRIALNTSASVTETPGTPMPGSPSRTPTPTQTRAVTASLERCDVNFTDLGPVEPVAMGQGYFDGDAIADLAVVDGSDARRVIVILTDPALLNNRETACQIPTPTTFQVGRDPVAIAVGFINDDRLTDLAVATADGISILLASGDPGQFTALAPVVVGSDPSSLALADFDLDGATDLAVANRGSNNAMILYGTGGERPSFGETRIFENIQSPRVVVAAFLDSNGWPDLAVASGDNTVRIHRQVSEDTFPTTGAGQARIVSLSTGTPTAMIAATLDGGSLQQLLVTTTSPVNATGNLVVIRQNGDQFSVGTPLSTGDSPSAIGLGDFVPSAGSNDAVVANVQSQAWFFPDNANGTFNNATSMPSLGGLPRALAVGDFDGDQEVDVVTGNETGFDLTFLLSSRVAPTPTPTITNTVGPSNTPTITQTPGPSSTPVPPTPDGTATPKEGTFELSSCSISAPSEEPISDFAWLGLGAALLLARRRCRGDVRSRGGVQ